MRRRDCAVHARGKRWELALPQVPVGSLVNCGQTMTNTPETIAPLPARTIETVWVTDAELIRRSGVPRAIMRARLR